MDGFHAEAWMGAFEPEHQTLNLPARPTTATHVACESTV
jgi:hypothetical protein